MVAMVVVMMMVVVVVMVVGDDGKSTKNLCEIDARLSALWSGPVYKVYIVKVCLLCEYCV